MKEGHSGSGDGLELALHIVDVQYELFALQEAQTFQAVPQSLDHLILMS